MLTERRGHPSPISLPAVLLRVLRRSCEASRRQRVIKTFANRATHRPRRSFNWLLAAAVLLVCPGVDACVSFRIISSRAPRPPVLLCTSSSPKSSRFSAF